MKLPTSISRSGVFLLLMFISFNLLAQDNAIDFNGTTQYATASDPFLVTGNADHTFETWVKIDAAQTGHRWIAWWGDPSLTSNELVIIGYDAGSSNQIRVHHLGDDILTSTVLPIGVWTHVALTYSGAARTSRIYLDGVFQEEITFSTDLNLPAPVSPGSILQLGTYNSTVGGSLYIIDGKMDETRFWSEARTDAEIVALYDQELGGVETNLAAYYDFQDISGDMLNDLSSNGNAGSLIGSPVLTSVDVPTVNPSIANQEIEVLGNSLAIASGSNTPNLADDTDYGDVPVGGTAVKTYTIVNTGSLNLNVSDVQISGADYTIGFVPSGGVFIVAPGASEEFDINVAPTSTGTKLATITISSDDSDEGTYTFDVTANGISNSPFITTWQTTTASEPITIPTVSGETYNYTVDWGDGNSGAVSTDVSPSHVYVTSGTYTVSIVGDFPRIYFNNGTEGQQVAKIQTIEQWGDIAWTSMNAAFYGCNNLTYNASDAPDLSGVTDMNTMFRAATSFNGDISINNWDVSTITDMGYMFYAAHAFNQPLDLWDVSSVTNMSFMFRQNNGFNQDISDWDVSSVTDMSFMFFTSPAFNNGGVPLDWGIKTASVTTMQTMFREATAFNQPIGDWDVSSVTNMSNMISGDAMIFNQDISTWNVINVTTMAQMFSLNPAFNNGGAALNWGAKTANVSNMIGMFNSASAFDQEVGNWDIGAVTDMTSMLDNTALSITNYDATLIGWADDNGSTETIPTGISLDASGLTYSGAAFSARDFLVNTQTWTISGDVSSSVPSVKINEVVTDPQTDWSTNGFNGTDGLGTISNIDEYIELYVDEAGLDFNTGWSLEVYDDDGTTLRFSGDLTNSGAFQVVTYFPAGGGAISSSQVGDFIVLGNPSGSNPMTNDVDIVLLYSGTEVDRVDLGGSIGQAPDGNASGLADESVSRKPNAADTDADDADFQLAKATPGTTNDNNALDFNGTADYVDLNDPASLAITGDLTLEAWVFWDGNTTAQIQTIISRAAETEAITHNINYQFQVNTDGTLRFLYEQGAGVNEDVSSTSPISSGEWTHVSVTRFVSVTSEVTFYINGQGSGSYSGLTNADGGTDPSITVWIGANNQSGLERYFDGQLDAVRVWNTPRTQEEIVANAYVELSNTSGLVASYNFNHTGGNPTDDAGSNDGVLNGAAGYVASAAFDADVFPPIFLNATPNVNNIDSDNADLNIQLNELGHAYYVVVLDDAGATEPTFAEVLAGTGLGGTGQIASGDFPITSLGLDVVSGITGLSSLTSYHVYVVAQDDEGVPNDQTSVSRVDFATITPPENAIAFDGTDDRIVVTDNANLNTLQTGDFTIEFWAKLNSADITQTMTFIDKYHDGTGSIFEGFLIHPLQTTGELRACYMSGTNLRCYDGTTNLFDDSFHHLAVVKTGTTIEIYVDGQPDGTTEALNITTGSVGTVDMGIGGRNYTADNDLTAEMDELRFWSDARTQIEIFDNAYTSSLAGDANLVASYDFDSNSGDAIDLIAGNNGTLSAGDPTYVTSTALAADVFAPIVANYIETAITSNSVDFDIEVNETSDLYYVVTESTSPPSSAEVRAGQDENGIPVALSGSFTGVSGTTSQTISGLVGSTAYELYFVVEDAAAPANVSSVLSGAIFTDVAPNYALDFNGSSDYIEVSPLTGLPSGNDARTVEAWIKTTGTALRAIVNWSSNPIANNQRFGIMTNNGYAYVVGEFNDFSGTTLINDDIWHHIAVSHDGTTTRLYVDGILDASSITTYNTTLDRFIIGARPDNTGSELFLGQIDEVRVWNTTRSINQIQAFKDVELNGSEPGLLAYYNFSEGPGSGILGDLAGTPNTGTLTAFADLNTPWVSSNPAIGDALPTDVTNPSVVISSSASPGPTSVSPIPVTFTFTDNDIITGFELVDIVVGNGTASNLATGDNLVFTADITPFTDGSVTVNLAADAVTDLTGNGNTAAAEFSIGYTAGVAPFITTWQTTGASETITIPGTGTNYQVYWEEEGNVSNNGAVTGLSGGGAVTLPTAGIYRFEISGDFTRILMNGSADADKLLTIEQWGDIAWTSMEEAFRGCSNLTYNAIDAPDLSGVLTMRNMFANATSFDGDLSNWDVTNVTNMRQLFNGASSFNGNITTWLVGNVTNMESMFQGATSFNQNISGWNMINVTQMTNLFSFALAFNQPIGNWTLSSSPVTMVGIFNLATAFNQPLNNWDMTSVTSTESMFNGATSFNQDLNSVGWNSGMSNVNNTNSMFTDATSFNGDISGWDVSSVAQMQDMFRGATVFNADISAWSVGSVVNLRETFTGAVAFDSDLSGWSPSLSLSNMRETFSGATSFNSDISGWNVSNVSIFERTFFGATSFDQNLDSWDISSATDVSNFLSNSGLSTSNYDLILIGWAALDLTDGLSMGVSGLTYCVGSAARQSVITDDSWTINGDTEDCSSLYTVTTTADSGEGSLRQAIINANASGAKETITFGIAAGSIISISSASLPAITNSSGMIIDASTVSGWSMDGDMMIEIDGSALSSGENGLDIDIANVEIYGLKIVNFPGDGIEGGGAIGGAIIGASAKGNVISGNGNNGISATGAWIIDENRIGTNAAGSVAMTNGINGISLSSGGSSVVNGNLLSGNVASGLNINANGGHTIANNFIGTNVAGDAAIPNQNGINANTTSNILIADNLISGNTQFGFTSISGSSDHSIFRNKVGTDAAGTGALPNGAGGFSFTGNNNEIGRGTPSGEGNIIAFNGGPAITMTGSGNIGNTFVGNAIFNNTAGIDLSSGANAGIAVPVITLFDGTNVSGTSVGTERIHIYKGDGAGQGEILIDSVDAVGGFWSYGSLSLTSGEQVVATATDANGTSEFAFEALAPEINVKYLEDPIASGGSIDLGWEFVGGSISPETVVIENTGSADLTISIIDNLSSIEFPVTQATSGIVSSAAQTDFTVGFSPTAPGVASQNITILNDDADESSYVVQAVGFGYPNESGPGSALSFNGSTDFVTVPDDPSLQFGTGDFTWETWFYFDGNDQLGQILQKRNNTAPFNQITLSISNGDAYSPLVGKRLGAIILPDGRSGNANDRFVFSPADLSVGWHHAALVNTYASGLELFLDGESQGTSSASHGGLTLNAPFDLRIASSEAGTFFAGQIDEVRIWNAAVSQSDINSYMLINDLASPEHPQVTSSSLVANYRFDENAGTTLYDLSLSNDGSFDGTPAWVTSEALSLAPQITSQTPTPGATGVDPTTTITVVFDQNVLAGAGNIDILNQNSDIVESFDVTNPGEVSFSGNTVSLTPSLLGFNTEYSIIKPANTIMSLSGKSLAAITLLSVWSFTTEAQTQAENLIFSNTSENSVDIFWTNGDGAERLVAMRQIDPASAGFPGVADNITYNANSTYGIGDDIGEGWFVVGVGGISPPLNVSGLSGGLEYTVAVLEYSSAGPGTETYNINAAADNPSSFFTNSSGFITVNQPTGGTFEVGESIGIDWTLSGVNASDIAFIELIADGGSGAVTVIEDSNPFSFYGEPNGAFNWTIDQVVNNPVIRVRDAIFAAEGVSSPITINSPNISFEALSNPTTCGGTDGSITIAGLLPSTNYNVSYNLDASPEGPIGLFTTAGGQLTIGGFGTSSIDNISVEILGINSNILTGGPFNLEDGTPSITILGNTSNTDCSTPNGALDILPQSSESPISGYDVDLFNGNSTLPGDLVQTILGVTSSQIFDNLNAGSYTVRVLNPERSGSCEATILVDIIDETTPPSISVGNVNITNPSVAAAADGAIDINNAVPGGSGNVVNYTYQYYRGSDTSTPLAENVDPGNGSNPTSVNSANISGLTADIYSFTITEIATGCVSNLETFTLVDPGTVIEDFETFSAAGSIVTLSTGEYHTAGPYVENAIVNSGSTAMRLASAGNDAVVTPQIDGNTDAAFYYAASGTGEAHFQVETSVDGGAYVVALATQTATSSAFNLLTVPLTEGTGSSVRVRITALSGISDQDLIIDDFEFGAYTEGNIYPPIIDNLFANNPEPTEVGFDITVDLYSDLFYVVTTSPTSPTPSQVEAGQDHNGDPAPNFGSSSGISGTLNGVIGSGSNLGNDVALTQGVTYYLHFIAKESNNLSNVSATLTSDPFTTPVPSNIAIATIGVPAANLTPGSTNNLIYKMQLDITNADASFDGMAFTPSFTATSDFTQFNFYQALGTDDFAGASLLESSTFLTPGNSYGLPENNIAYIPVSSIPYTAGTPVFFYISVDVAGGAVDNNTISIDLPAVESNFAFGTPNVLEGTGLAVSNTFTVLSGAATTITIANVSPNEGDGSVTITALLSAALASDVSFDYATSPNTATADVDYTTSSGTVTIIGGNISADFVVNLIGDNTVELDEDFDLTYSNFIPNGENVVLSNSSSIVTILNDDAMQISFADVIVNEGDGVANVNITADNPADRDIDIDFNTSDNSAIVGSDYDFNSGTATLTAGTTSATVSITITDDGDSESDETFDVNFNNPNFGGLSAVTLSNSSAQITIEDNDASGAITSISDGNWSETATWDGGAVPSSADDVVIAHAVTLDVADVTVNAFTINSSAGPSFTLGSNTLRVNGDVDIQDSNNWFSAGGTLSLSGTDQIYSHFGDISYDNIAFEGSGTITIQYPSGSAMFVDASVDIGNGLMLSFTDTPELVLNGTASFVNEATISSTDKWSLLLNGSSHQVFNGDFLNVTFQSAATLDIQGAFSFDDTFSTLGGGGGATVSLSSGSFIELGSTWNLDAADNLTLGAGSLFQATRSSLFDTGGSFTSGGKSYPTISMNIGAGNNFFFNDAITFETDALLVITTGNAIINDATFSGISGGIALSDIDGQLSIDKGTLTLNDDATLTNGGGFVDIIGDADPEVGTAATIHATSGGFRIIQTAGTLNLDHVDISGLDGGITLADGNAFINNVSFFNGFGTAYLNFVSTDSFDGKTFTGLHFESGPGSSVSIEDGLTSTITFDQYSGDFGGPGFDASGATGTINWTNEVTGPTTFEVTTTADDGTGSLREAISLANAATSDANITFNLTGDGTGTSWTISPVTELPGIFNTNSKIIAIDGSTQPGASRTSDLMVTINDENDLISGLAIEGDNVEVYGLKIVDFDNGIYSSGVGTVNNVTIGKLSGENVISLNITGIYFEYSNGLMIQNNYIGTDPTGTTVEGNVDAIYLDVEASNSTIQENVISGNSGIGVFMPYLDNNILNNKVGVSEDGMSVLGNDIGIKTNGENFLIQGNQIGGNTTAGIQLDGFESGKHTIMQNYIGTDVTGSEFQGNGIGIEGLDFDQTLSDATTIGSDDDTFGNIIAYNTEGAISLSGTAFTRVKILNNQVYENGKGIELLNGADGGQNPPTIDDIGISDVTGTIDGVGPATIHLYNADPVSGNQGKSIRGVGTIGAGLSSWSVSGSFDDFPDLTATITTDDFGTSQFYDPNASVADPNYVLDFDGIDESVVAGYLNDLDGATGATLEAWVYRDGATAGDIFGKNNFNIQITASGSAYINFSAATTNQVETISGVIPVNQWTHIAVTFDGSAAAAADKAKVYIDGAEATLSTVDADLDVVTELESPGNGDIIIGRSTYFEGNYFDGKIDEARIWDYTRTAQEIADTYNLRMSGLETGLVAYYNFEESTGTELFDNSSAGNTGQLINMEEEDWIDFGTTLGDPPAYLYIAYPTAGESVFQDTDIVIIYSGSGFSNGDLLNFEWSNDDGVSWNSLGSDSYTGEAPEFIWTVDAATYPIGSAYKVRVTNDGANIIGESETFNIEEAVVGGDNYALTFNGAIDGSGSYIDVSSASLPSGDLTLEAWVYYPLGGSGTFFQTIIEFNSDSPWLGIENGNLSVYQTTATDSESFPEDTWTHIAAAYNSISQTVDLYRDGVALVIGADASAITPFSGTNGLLIGGDPTSNEMFTGQLDEVRIWNTYRSNQEIIDNKDSELLGNETGLIHYFNFNEGPASTSIFDAVSLSESTISNFDVANDWVTGFEPSIGVVGDNNTLDFDGIDDRIEIPPFTISEFAEEFTIEFWVKPTIGSGSANDVLSIDSGDGTDQFNISYVPNDDHFIFSSAGGGTLVSSSGLTDGEWHHFAFTIDNSNTGRLYQDGLEAGESAIFTLPADGDLWTIGANYDGTDYINNFTGQVDELRIYNEVKDSGQIRDTYILISLTSETGLLASYDFNLGAAGGENFSEEFLKDGTANTRDGALQNFNLSGPGSNWISSDIFEMVNTISSVQASSIVVSTLSETSVDISWSNGDGERRVVLIAEGNTGFPDMSNLSFYYGDPYFGFGFNTENGFSAVYNGYGSDVQVYGLQPNKEYIVAVVETNGPILFSAYNEDNTQVDNPLTFDIPANINNLTEEFDNGLPATQETGTYALETGEWTIGNVLLEETLIFSGSGAVRLVNTEGSELISPPLEGGAEVNFYYAIPGTGENNFEVYESVNGAGFTNTVFTNTASSSTYQLATINLAHPGDIVELAIFPLFGSNDQDLLIDQFNADFVQIDNTAPPVLSALSLSKILDISLDADITVDVTSDLYYVITESAVSPDEIQILSGLDDQDSPAVLSGNFGGFSGGQNFGIGDTDTPLTELTSYFIYWVAETGGQTSNILSETFTTLESVSVAVSTITVPDADILIGTTSDPIYKLQFVVSGAEASTLGLFLIPTGTFAQADFDQFNLWESVGTDDFANATLLGSNGFFSGDPEVPDGAVGSYFTSTYPEGTTVFIYLTADVSSSATVGNTISFELPAIGQNFGFNEPAVDEDAGLEAGATFTIQLSDIIPPTISIDLIGGDDVINGTEDDTDVVIGGTSDAEDGQVVTVGLNGQTYSATISSGTWIATIPSADVQALNASETVTADVSDQAGNAAIQASRIITYDAIGPVVVVDVQESVDDTPAITGSINESVSTVTVTVLGVQYPATITDFTWAVENNTIVSLEVGTYDVSAEATDLAGNVGNDGTIDELKVLPGAPEAIDAINVDFFSFTASWNLRAGVDFYRLDVSSDESFSNLLPNFANRQINSGVTQDVVELNYGTNYYYRVRAVYPSGDVSPSSNVISVKTLLDPATVADSLALLTIYANTEGEDWSSVNWFDDIPLRDWDGIEMTGTRVTTINLNGFGLSGDYPSLSSGLEAVETLNLGSNDLVTIPDLSGFTSLSSLNLTSNKLQFGSIEPNFEISGALFNPQDSVGSYAETLFEISETPYSINRQITGSSNSYTWFQEDKEGTVTELDGASGWETPITISSFENEGFYFAKVTSDVATGLTLTTQSLFVKVSSRERDSTALAELYIATGGSEWTAGSDTWTQGSLDTWEGLGFTEDLDRVISVTLPDNNMDGEVPASFADIAGLTTVNFSGNSLRSFPNLSQISGLTTLDISENRLVFKDIIPNKDVSGVSFDNQKRFGFTKYDTLDAGLDKILTDFDDINFGDGATFQWKFGEYLAGELFNNDVEDISGGESQTYTIDNIDINSMGTYRLVVDHPDVDLTIESRNQNIMAQTDFFGSVTIDETTPVDDAEVIIWRQTPDGPFSRENETTVDANGDYVLEDVVLGNFVVQVKPNREKEAYERTIQTYYIQEESYTEADTLFLTGVTEGVNIDVIQIPEPPVGGTAAIGGFIESDFDEEIPDEENTGRVTARRKVRKAGCSMRRFKAQGRPGQDDEEVEEEIAYYVETDDDGFFNFSEVADGKYLLNIEFPGVPIDENAEVVFEIGGDRENQLFDVEVLITESGINVSQDEVLFTLKPYVKDIVLYPNPTEGVIALDYTVYREIDDLKIQLVTTGGIILDEQEIDHWKGSRRTEIDLTDHAVGVYYLVFTDEVGTFSHHVKVGRK